MMIMMTNTHTRRFSVHPSGQTELVSFPLVFLFLSLYILFNTIPPCPSQIGEGTAVKEEEWRESIFMRGN